MDLKWGMKRKRDIRRERVRERGRKESEGERGESGREEKGGEIMREGVREGEKRKRDG